MNISAHVFDHALSHLSLSGAQASFVVIGAMDGISFDEFHSYIRKNKWSGLLVEPIPEQFRRLVTNYTAIGCSPDMRYENSAIAEHDGSVQMLTINHEAVDCGKVHECFGGMSAIYPPRNGLASEGDAETVRLYGELIEVPCITLRTLLDRHSVEALDILCIDAEGWDFKILRQLDFTRWRPKVIRIEYINLTAEEKAAAIELLDRHQYHYCTENINLDAVAVEFWDLVGSLPRPIAARPSEPIAENLTLVTSLLPLLLDHDRHSPALFQQVQDQLKALNPDQPLFLYTAAGSAELAARERNAASTFLVRRELEDIAKQEHPMLIHNALRNSEAGEMDVKGDAMRRWLSLSALFLFNDASIYNAFSTEYLLWVDIELLPVLARGLVEKIPEWICVIEDMARDARLWLPAGPAPERKEFEDATWLWLDSPLRSVLFSVTGQVFGGSKAAINSLNGVYYACLDRLLRKGILCSRDEVLTLIAHSHHYLCNPERNTA